MDREFKVKIISKFICVLFVIAVILPNVVLAHSSKYVMDLKYLTGKETLGRHPGAIGNERAGDYIASEFEKMGLDFLDESDSYSYYFDAEIPVFDSGFIEIYDGDNLEKRYELYDDFLPAIQKNVEKRLFDSYEDEIGFGKITESGIWFDMTSNEDRFGKFKTNLISRGKGGQRIVVSKTVYDELEVAFESGKRMKIDRGYSIESKEIRNIVGVLRGKGNAKKPYIISAHFDHEGIGSDGKYFAGALDNASGTVAMLELMRRFSGMESLAERDIYFAAFNAEEMGLLGSKIFARELKNKGFEPKNINLDEIGGIEDVSVSMLYYGKTLEESAWIEDMCERFKDAGMNIELEDNSYGSDHYSFNSEGFDSFTLCHDAGLGKVHTYDDVSGITMSLDKFEFQVDTIEKTLLDELWPMQFKFELVSEYRVEIITAIIFIVILIFSRRKFRVKYSLELAFFVMISFLVLFHKSSDISINSEKYDFDISEKSKPWNIIREIDASEYNAYKKEQKKYLKISDKNHRNIVDEDENLRYIAQDDIEILWQGSDKNSIYAWIKEGSEDIWLSAYLGNTAYKTAKKDTLKRVFDAENVLEIASVKNSEGSMITTFISKSYAKYHIDWIEFKDREEIRRMRIYDSEEKISDVDIAIQGENLSIAWKEDGVYRSMSSKSERSEIANRAEKMSKYFVFALFTLIYAFTRLLWLLGVGVYGYICFLVNKIKDADLGKLYLFIGFIILILSEMMFLELKPRTILANERLIVVVVSLLWSLLGYEILSRNKNERHNFYRLIVVSLVQIMYISAIYGAYSYAAGVS